MATEAQTTSSAPGGPWRVKAKAPRWLPVAWRKGSRLACEVNRCVCGSLSGWQVRTLNGIGGWLDPREGMVLFYFAYRPTCAGRVVEIGSFEGRSTAWLATGLRLAGQNERVAAIDPHRRIADLGGIYDAALPIEQRERIQAATGLAEKDITTYEVLLDNITRVGLDAFVEAIRSTSAAAAERWTDPVRLLFVDGSHEYDDAIGDLRLWEPHVQPGGIICIHDTKPGGPFPGVARATDEYLAGDRRFTELLDTGNMRVFKKKTV